MQEHKKLIADLIATMDNAIDGFDTAIDLSQKSMYSKVLELIKELEVKNGRVKSSVKNLRIIGKLKRELAKAILNDKYLKQVDKYLAAYSEVEAVQTKYFTTIDAAFTTTAIFKELKHQAIEAVYENLTESGLSANVTTKVQSLLRDNIVSGNTYAGMQEQVREFLLTTEAGDGALARYSKQIVNDAMYGYSRQYTQLATEDLGLQWYMYVGSTKKTSREFCIKMIDAADGCMPYVHRSQLKALVKGHICGEQLTLNSKTKLPTGMIDGTNEINIITRAGGYNCRHKFQPVSSVIVPKKLRQQYEK